MFRKLLVPLDGSARAERALPVAARIARSTGATVVLLQVITDAADATGYMIPAVIPSVNYIERDEREAQHYLSKLVHSDDLRGVSVEIRIDVGAAASTILDSIPKLGIDGVILCSHGRTGLTRWALGSVALQIVRHAHVPTLVLRELGGSLVDDEVNSDLPFRILIPLDGSELAEASLLPALQVGAICAGSRTCEAHLTRVLPFTMTPDYDSLREQAAQEAKEYLDRTTKRLSVFVARNVRFTTSILYELDAAHALARMTRVGENVVGAPDASGYDLIAMATHGRTGLARLALGSITERVLNSTVIPALIARPQETQPADVSEKDEVIERGTPQHSSTLG